MGLWGWVWWGTSRSQLAKTNIIPSFTHDTGCMKNKMTCGTPKMAPHENLQYPLGLGNGLASMPLASLSKRGRQGHANTYCNSTSTSRVRTCVNADHGGPRHTLDSRRC